MAQVKWQKRAEKGSSYYCRFKIIYRYDAVNDIVHVADIWDTRRDPDKLANRIK